MKSIFKYKGTGNNGTFSWMMQRISGLVLLVVIAIHFFGQVTGAEWGLIHYVVGCVLVFATWHGVNGLKMITDDYVSCRGLRVFLLCVYWILGIFIVLQGLTILP